MHATQPEFAKDSWQTPRNARSLRAFMALRNQEIAARLRELRGQRPQTTIADELGVAERTYQNWEAGDAKPSYRNLQRLAEYYGVGEEYILTGENEEGFRVLDGRVIRQTKVPDLFVPAPGGDRGVNLLAAVEKLLVKQNELLARQSKILERIEDAIAAEDDSARRLAADGDAWADAVIARITAHPAEPQSPKRAPKARAKSGTRRD